MVSAENATCELFNIAHGVDYSWADKRRHEDISLKGNVNKINRFIKLWPKIRIRITFQDWLRIN